MISENLNKKTISLEELSKIIDAELVVFDSIKTEILITGVKGIETAEQNDITFADTPKFLELADNSNCAAIITWKSAKPTKKPQLRVNNPKLAFAKALEFFDNNKPKPPAIHQNAVISKTAKIGNNVYIGPNVVIEDNVFIGDNSQILANVYIGANTKIGNNAKIYPNSTIYHNCVIGINFILHSNSVIGSDGFGYAQTAQGHYKVPQIGNVEIGDNVEIGANTSIDRATTMSTRIGNGVKIDNHVHIAHNVQIGDNTLIIAHAGIAGSAVVGKNCIIAGHSGVRDHITIGDNVVVVPMSGVTKDIPANNIISGFPAKPHITEKKLKAAYMRLPKIAKTVSELVTSIQRLQRRIERSNKSKDINILSE